LFSVRENFAGYRRNTKQMKNKFTLKNPVFWRTAALAAVSILLPGMLSAQLTGTKNIPGDYATLEAAIIDLNTQGVGAGGVTLNVLPGNLQTAPVGGYQITASGSLADPIVIQGNSNQAVAFTPQAAGSLSDAVFKIIGGDFIAITGFNIQENPGNTVTAAATNNMTEWGIALLYASPTNGAQNNLIASNLISLTRTYNHSWAVYSNTRHTATAPTVAADITAPSGSNSNNRVYANNISAVNYGIAFIGSSTPANMDIGNDIGGTSAATANGISNWGSTAATSSFVSNSGTLYCIYMNHQIGDNVSFNSINSFAVSGSTSALRGIFKDYTIAAPTGTFTTTINNNTITLTSGNASGAFEHIRSQGMGTLATATININNNTIINSAVTAAGSTSAIVGIINTSAPGVLNMNSNVIRGITTTTTTTSGNVTGISNTGSVVSTVNMTNNQLGNTSGGFITYSAANSGTLTGLNAAGASTATVTITGNDIRGITHSVAGSAAHIYVGTASATGVVNVSNNTFTALNVNTTGAVTFFNANASMATTGSQTFNNNSIVTSFNKGGAGNNVTVFTSNAASAATSSHTATGNNFSNITVSGATAITGWSNTDGTALLGPLKTITGNTFSNWTAGSGAILGMTVNFSGTNSTFSNNTFSNFTGTGPVTGMASGGTSAGTLQTISGNSITGLSSTGTGGTVTGISASSSATAAMVITDNTIHGLSSTGAANVSGIIIPSGISTTCTRNKIGDLQSSNAGGFVNGITVSGGTTITVTNNLIGDLRATTANAANVINGINITGSTTANIYFNTIYLNATSSGALFGTSGIFASTTPTVDLRNNLVVNLSTPNSTGLTAAYRRSTTTLASYAALSNNNSFYAGTPGPNNVIFFDGTNSDQTLAAYQTRVAGRDGASASVNPVFASTTVSNVGFLHIPAASSYVLESGGTPIAGITVDFDNDVRPGPAGSVNGGAIASDIGADEYDGILLACTGTPTAGTASLSPASRCGSGTFTLSVTGASGGPGITYQWQSSTTAGGPYTNIPGAITSTYITANITTTTYFVLVVTCTTSGLTATTNEITGVINALPVVTVSPISANFCNPGGTPVALTASGASTYAWSPAAGLSATTGTSVNASPASTTVYTVTGTDANGCINTATTTITAITNPVITSVTATPASICTGNNSQLQANVTFNTPVNSYAFSSGTGASLDPMTGATTAIGSNGDDTPSGVLPIGFTFNFNGVNFTDFSVSPDGWIRMGNVAPTSQFTNSVTSTTNIPKIYAYWDDVATGTNGGVSYRVTGSAPNRILKVQWFVTVPYNFSGAANSTFQVWMYETTNVVEFRYGAMGITGLESASGGLTGGATNFQSITFSSNTASTSTANNTNINPPASGTIYTFTPPSVTYSWLPATFLSSTSILNPVATAATATTTYTFTATNGVCSNNSPVTLTVNPLPTIGASASASAICIGGSSDLTATGAVTYTWMPGSLTGTTVTVSPVATTTYTVTGTDANGCVNTAQVTVVVNTLPAVSASATPATICAGSTANLSATGAVTYNWMPGSLSGAAVAVTPSATTTYTVTGTDGNGCENTAQVTVSVNNLPTVSASASATSICAGASTTLSATGANTYVWNPGNLSGASVSVTPSATTTYTVTGTDGNGCEGVSTITITVNPLPTVAASASPAAVCPGGSSSLTATGAVTYVWNPGNLSGSPVSVTPSATTTYTVTGTDANGCDNTDVVTVTVNSLPTVTASASATSICTGASTTLNASGAVSYSWMPGSLSGASVTVSPTATTTYTVTGTDANGCENTAQITITVNPLPTVGASASPAAVCPGGSSTLTGTGAVSYVWNPGNLSGTSVTVTPSATTTYTVTGTDANGCVNTDVTTVTVNPLPVVDATASPLTICVGGSSTLAATGASTYTWMPGSLSGSSVTVSPTTTTTYTVTGTDANGCVNTDVVTVTVNPLPTITASTTNSTICAGASTTLNASGGNTYTWMPGSLTGASVSVTPSATTTYTVTGTNTGTGCSNTAIVTITVNPLPTVAASASPAAICVGGSSTLSATGASTYMWMPGSLTGSSVTVSPTATTTYTVTGTDANGCTNTATETVTVNALPTVAATASPATICVGASSTLAATGAATYSWMPGSLSGASVSVTPSATTTYTVTGTDANGCQGTDVVTVTVNPLPTITASATSTSICAGASTTLNASGGNTYTWMPGSLTGASVSVTPSATTTYTVTGVDANGCSNTQTVTITVNPLPTVVASASSTSICTGNSVTLSATGASTYTWNPGSLTGASVSVTPSATTTYTVTGVDANGCSNTATITITVGAQPTITASSSPAAICIGGSTTLTATGGVTYNWMPGSLSGASVSVTPTATTTYTVTGTVSPGCFNTATVTVTVNPLPVIVASASSSTICTGASTTLSATGASTYTWNPGSLSGASVSVSPTATTTYTVTGVDANGCSNTQTITITVNPLPTVTASTSAAAICIGGSATLSATGADTYVWNPGNLSGASVTVSPTATTTYTVTGTNTVTGCENTQTVSVTVNPLPTVTASTSAAAICIGGSATLSATGANTYVWNPGNLSGASVTVSPTATTTYTVTGTNTVTGCVNTETVSVTVNSLPTVSTSATVTTICVGASTTLSATGANTYVWNPGNLSGSSVTVSPTATTTYTVTGTNTVTGCSNTQTIAITVNPLPTVTASSSVSAICVGGSATLSATGANTYVWNPGNLSGASVIVSPTATTTYTVTGTNTSTGCTNTQTVSVTVNPLPVITANTSAAAICVGGSATLSATGANIYVWNPGNLSGASVTVSPTATTTYTVTGTNTVTGCSNTQTVSVTVNALPTVSATTSASTVCAGTTVTLSATGANTYVWNPGNLSGSSVNVTPSATTTYTVTGTNTATGCVNTQTVTVNVNPLPVLTITPSATSICSGNSVTLNVTGANTYTWQPGNLTGASVTVFLSTTTTFTVQGVNTITGCTNTGTVTITVNPLPTITATASPLSICVGGNTTLSATGANTYVWNPGNLSGASVTVSPATSTVYTVTGTNTVTGCSASQSVSVNVDALPVITATASSAVICAGQTTSLTATGASTYVWNPGNLSGSSITVTPAATTTYTVTGTNSVTGCSNTQTITITVNPLPVVTATASTLTSCAGSPVTLTATGAGAYNWQPGNLTGGSVVVNPTVTTTYTVTGTNTLTGCTGTRTITITVNPLPVVTAAASQTVVCAGSPSTLTATGANTYTWNPGALNGAVVTVTPTATTTYTVTGTNTVTGCVNTQTVTVNVNALPVVTASTTASVVCVGDTATLSATGANTYTWNPGNVSGSSINVSPAVSTTYTVTGTNTVTGCVNTATVSVGVNALPVLTAASTPAAICVGDSAVISASGANTYLWTPGNLTGASVTVSPTATATYTVTGTSTVTGCMNTQTVTVTVNSLPVVALGADTAVCGGPLTLDAGNAGSTFLWSDNSSAQTLSVTTSGVYAVTVTNTNGCEATDSINVTINALPVVNLGVDTTVCGSLVLNAGNAGASYLWNDTTTAQTLTASASGVYSVIVTDSLGCSNIDSIAVTVNALPAVNLGNDVTACAGGPVLLDAGVAGMADYNWNTGDSTQTILATTTGVYVVTATDSLGCSATDSVNVSFSALPVVNLGNDTTLCGGQLTLDAGTGGNIFTWSTGDTTQTIVVNSTAVYGVTVTDSLGCSGTDSVLVTINALPVVSLSLTQDTLCDQDSLFVLIGTPAGGTFGGPFVTGNTFDPVAAGVGSHVVFYTFTDSLGCSATDSATVIVDPCTGIAENAFNGTMFNVYPNPNNGFFNLALSNANYAELSIQVYTVLGQVVYSDMASNVTGDVIRQIDLTNLANGAYYVKVTAGAATQTVKVMKQD
jgi:hypothetical protein